MIAVEYSLLMTAGTLQFSMTFISAFIRIYVPIFYKQRNYDAHFMQLYNPKNLIFQYLFIS